MSQGAPQPVSPDQLAAHVQARLPADAAGGGGFAAAPGAGGFWSFLRPYIQQAMVELLTRLTRIITDDFDVTPKTNA